MTCQHNWTPCPRRFAQERVCLHSLSLEWKKGKGRARQAEAQLIQSIEEEAEARARRFQRRKDKRERRSHSSTQPANPTVILLNYQPPREPSDEEGEVEPRRLDFDEGSRAEPDTPEELHQQPNQPSSPRGTSPPPDLDATGCDPGTQPVEVDDPERCRRTESTN